MVDSSFINEVKPHQNGTVDTIQYRKLEKLGEGAFGSCFKVENVRNKAVTVIKVIKKSRLKNHHYKAQLM